jgi:nucleoside-diphosphate-sugar epimerase
MVGDGKEFLDFTYIDDLVQGIYLTMVKKESLNNIFNITYGKSRSLLDLIKIINKNIKNVKVKKVKRDKLMPFRGTLSVDKAKKLIGYKPKFNIDKGIPKLIKWYENTKF